MTVPIGEQSVYLCEDGTAFPVEWPSEEAPRHTWRWNEDHHPAPFPPLIAAIDHGRKPGGDHAYNEAGVDPPHMFREWTIANGFQYIRASPLAPAEMDPFVTRGQALSARHGGPTRVWEQHSLPRAREACEQLRAMPPETPVADAVFLFDYAFQLTHVGGPTVLFPLLMGLQGLLIEAIGPEGALLTQEVTQGGANDTIASDQAIWELGQLAKPDTGLTSILTAGNEGVAAIDRLPNDHPFRRGFETHVETYRWRTESWDATSPTVGEDPARILPLIRRAMHAPAPAAAAERAMAERQQAAVKRIEAELAGQPGLLGRFREILGALDGYVGVREGRALWQLIATGSLRYALLKKGRRLAEAGMLGSADDVFFLLPDEIAAGTGGTATDYRDLVTQRRSAWEYWKTKRPPHLIGAEPSGPMPLPMPVESTGPVLRGIPASRGVVTAPVRVLTDLAEADSFQGGEILVCAMTSPPWTPLFAIAAAVVTDSGAPLSHPAIAAREYGIPCIVGAKDASRKLRTGEIVTVDGAAGTVTRAAGAQV